MQRNLTILFFIVQSLFIAFQATAQKPTYKVAVFIPLYADSATEGYNQKAISSLPKQAIPGLDFYNGVSLAIDSLKNEGASLEIFIYDSKSNEEPIESILHKDEMQHMNLIIAAFNSKNEIKTVADYAFAKKIPLISATYPNDGGITHNPYLILLSTTLRTHCQELYKFIQKNYATNNIILFRRKGAVEDIIQSYFTEAGRSTPSIPLKYKTVELSDTFTIKQLQQFLDSNKNNLAICASINEAFILRTIKALNAAHNIFAATLIAMPTVDGLKIADNPLNEKSIDYIFSTPFYFTKPESLNKNFSDKYQLFYNARPTDMAFKGFETMYRFAHLLMQYGSEDLTKHLSDKNFRLFNDWDIKPFRKDNQLEVDYWENRKLYFIKKTGNTVKAVY